MKRFKGKTSGWLVRFILIPPITWAGEASLQASGVLPKPYVYKDMGLGDGKPKFTINKSGVLPDGLSLMVQQRSRYETLNSQFRSGTTGNDQIISLRTLVQSKVLPNS